jgi:hypothetical protein
MDDIPSSCFPPRSLQNATAFKTYLRFRSSKSASVNLFLPGNNSRVDEIARFGTFAPFFSLSRVAVSPDAFND